MTTIYGCHVTTIYGCHVTTIYDHVTCQIWSSCDCHIWSCDYHIWTSCDCHIWSSCDWHVIYAHLSKRRCCSSSSSFLTLSTACALEIVSFPPSLGTATNWSHFTSRGPISTRSGTPCGCGGEGERGSRYYVPINCSLTRIVGSVDSWTNKQTDRQAGRQADKRWTFSSQWLNFQPGE